MATIAIDNEIKERAYLRAKKENISLRFVTQYLLQKYADGNVSFDLQLKEDEYTLEEEKAILWIQKNDKTVGPFSSAQDFLKELKS